MTILNREQVEEFQRNGEVAEWWADDVLDTARAYHDSEERYQRLRDAVLAWCDKPNWVVGEDGYRSIAWPDKAELREVVTRVERGES